MTEKHLFADVEQPFHVWVKEGTRWVLRDAAPGSDPQAGAFVNETGAERADAGVRPSGAA